MTKIDQLPTEVLMKIFGYLRSYGGVSLVSRRFYDVACSMPGSVSFSSIFRKNENHRSVMESVQNTRRKISKLSIRLGYNTETRESAISDDVAIVKKFSATVKRFELLYARMEMSDFLEMLSWLPNAEHLVFSWVREKPSPTDRQLSNECLNLHQLKTLELLGCSLQFIAVFNRLPAGVLTKLRIEYCSLVWDLLAGLLTQQSNIKELALTRVNEATLPDHIFDHLKLESLELHQKEYNSSHATILSKQTKLIHLRLRGDALDDQILNVITSQLSELESLHIGVNEAQVVPFKQIEKLKKLKELTLRTESLKVIETLAGLDNSRITTLSIEKHGLGEIIPVNLIVALANSVPNLKLLRLGYKFECQTIAAVMEHFNFVEILQMNIDPRIAANLLWQAIDVGRCFNQKLTALKIKNFPCDESVLTKLAAVCPNLKKLDIHSSPFISITPSLFNAILTGFKELESLRLHFNWWPFSTEYVECIMKHKNHLRSITLSGLASKYKLTAEHRTKLNVVFDVLKYEDDALMHLADTKNRL